jgi:hypothetical protein
MTTTPTAPATWPAAPERRPWSGGRTALVVAGGVIALLGASSIAGGVVVLWADQQRDGDGFMTAGPEVFSTDSYALSVPSLDLSTMGPDYLYDDDLLGDLRIELESVDADASLFVGIGPADDVAAYLDEVAHDELSDIGVRPFDADYQSHSGGEPDSDPESQTFWSASDSGQGSRALTWDVSTGDWAVVIMNTDGSAGIEADVSAGATLPIFRVAGIIALVGGGLLLIGGIAMVVVTIATRGRHAVVAPRDLSGPESS